MLPPLLKAVAREPELLLEHASAYAELAGAEAAVFGRGVKRRAVVSVVGVLAAAAALGLAGIAVLLVAAVPLAQMPHPELLWIVPGIPALIAVLAVAAWIAEPGEAPFDSLRRQIAHDAAWLGGAGSSSRTAPSPDV